MSVNERERAFRGSETIDEMAERMRRAGFDDWEISDEMALKTEAERAVETNTALLNSHGAFAFAERDYFEDATRFRKESTLQAPAPSEYDRAPAQAKSAYMATVQELVFRIEDAYDFGDFDAAHALEQEFAGAYMARMGEPIDAEQAPPPRPVKGEGRPAMSDETKTAPETQSQKQKPGVSVSMPMRIGEKDSMREWSYQGREMAEFTLPRYTTVDGKDVSFYRFSVEKRFVNTFENDPNYYHVWFPKSSRTGEPWSVRLSREFGSWEHPDAPAGEKGRFVVEENRTVAVASEAFEAAMQKYRDDRYAYATSHADGIAKNQESDFVHTAEPEPVRLGFRDAPDAETPSPAADARAAQTAARASPREQRHARSC